MLVPVGDHHLFTVDLGRGTPLLLHDGWVASWQLWLPLIERLQDDWRCIALDHRGTGASTLPADSISAEALVDDVFRVLDAYGIERAVIAGESMGALVCLQAVLRDPSRFLGLVTVGGLPRGFPVRPDAAAAMRTDWPAYVAAFVDACLPEPDADPLHRFSAGTLLPAGPEAAIRMSTAHAAVAPDLSAVTVPSLVLHGALDTVAPPTLAHQLADGLPGAELVVLDDAGHVPIVTRPDAVATAIRTWWSAVAPA